MHVAFMLRPEARLVYWKQAFFHIKKVKEYMNTRLNRYATLFEKN